MQCFYTIMDLLMYSVVIFIVIVHGHVSALELTKCALRNSTCQQELFQGIAGQYAPYGIPELGIEPIDPYHLENITMYPMDIVELTLVEGECLDIGKTCTLLRYENDVDNFRRIIEVVCDRIVIQGQYRMKTRKYFNKILGTVKGKGYGSIVLEEWYFKFDYPFGFERRDDGNIYTKANFDEAVWVSEVRRKATFSADNIMLNCYDVTDKVLEFLNKHWEIIFSDTKFGKEFHEKSISYYFEIYEKFYNRVPATEYYSDDLEPYVEENQNC